MSPGSTASAIDKALLEESADELYHQAPCGYLSTDADGLIVKINQTLLTWTGYSQAELAGIARFPSLLTPGGKIYYDTHFAPLLRMHGAANEIALDLVCKDGQRRPVLITAVQRTDTEGRPLLNRITVFDATQRRRYEQELLLARRRAEQVAAELVKANQELRRANADLEQFAYSASHDLKEPLRVIGIYSELLQRKYQGKLDAQADEYLSFTAESTRRMQALVDDLLAYTQAVHLTLQEVTAVAGDRVLDDALFILKGAIEEAGGRIERAPLPQLRVQEVHLLQLFQNIIANALKYCGKTPFIRISAEQEGDWWRVRIQDNGIGIEPEYAEQVFGLFKRLHNSPTYSGTGIGLAICRKIVDHYGGRIWAESEGTGKGSTFCFTLPGAEQSTSR